jgi:hypothetical protein
MNIFEAEKVVTCSLIKQGAYCRTEAIQAGLNIIVATWKSTLWRIVVKVIKTEAISPWPTDEEIRLINNKATTSNQNIVIAFVLSDSNIEYRAYEDGRIIRPRCIIKLKKSVLLVNA